MPLQSVSRYRVYMAAVVVFLLMPITVLASPDLSVGTEFRSYPLSGVLESEMGYNFLLWGDPTASPWYGYVRPSVYGETSISYNTLGGALDLFPVSFLRFRVGENAIQNDVDYKAYDCATYECRGRYNRTYAQVQLTLGLAGFFVQGRVQEETWSQGNPGSIEFIDPENGLALSPSGDRETIYRAMVGYKLSPLFTVTTGYTTAQSFHTNEASTFPFALAIYTSGDLVVGGGFGVFSSDVKPAELSGLFFLKWQILPGLDLN